MRNSSPTRRHPLFFLSFLDTTGCREQQHLDDSIGITKALAGTTVTVDPSINTTKIRYAGAVIQLMGLLEADNRLTATILDVVIVMRIVLTMIFVSLCVRERDDVVVWNPSSLAVLMSSVVLLN